MRSFLLSAFVTLSAFMAMPAFAAAVVGQPAPSFSGTDTKGVVHTLESFKGKTLVLEWTNHECPFVKKHYSIGSMQATQKEATADGVVWVRVISSAPGKQGNLSPADADRIASEQNVSATATLLDADGTIGKAYGAKTTPHMFVINPESVVVYAGAIDSDTSSDSTKVAGATNYVKAALADLKAGRAVATASTKPYGCSVKYAE